jgi:hypothetical protein
MTETEEVFPPKVPCRGRCIIGGCGDPGGPSSGPYGCGGCCYCLRGCYAEYEVEQALIPETPEQAKQRKRWESDQEANVDWPFPL